jgi:hypothetical protein
MYDLIASWMTSGGPLQELSRDDRGQTRHAQAAAEPILSRRLRPGFAFVRGLRAPRPLAPDCIDGCAAC